ncbi:Hypothetical protein SRAE_2000195700 [Strongyloides ratti]|uniref:Uncharacterized protein n=1 Tax=Strongyloides ratti TaxID=34506 RepID=A0A090LGQ2_STRRB|nr:Hypothetical protein SRAE_2000195700 [Strongyloides ratti]CEF67293.1 Hypothetical protein SRAE_2000195700 [Strongyloides ratti]
MTSPRNPHATLYNFKQQVSILKNQCKNKQRNVKEMLCHDAEMILQKAIDTIEILNQEKNTAIIEKDYSIIKKIDEEIVIIESTAINLSNLDILFKEKYTDDVVEPYIENNTRKEKIQKFEEEIQKIEEIENTIKMERENDRKKDEKERLKILRKDEYIKELDLHDIKKNTSFKESSNYIFFKESIKNSRKNINTSTDNYNEYNRRFSNTFNRSDSINEKNKSNNIEFYNQINSTIEKLSNPTYSSPNNEVRHYNKRKGPTEADIRAAMEKVRDEKYEELNHKLDEHYSEIEKIISGDN